MKMVSFHFLYVHTYLQWLAGSLRAPKGLASESRALGGLRVDN